MFNEIIKAALQVALIVKHECSHFPFRLSSCDLKMSFVLCKSGHLKKG